LKEKVVRSNSSGTFPQKFVEGCMGNVYGSQATVRAGRDNGTHPFEVFFHDSFFEKGERQDKSRNIHPWGPLFRGTIFREDRKMRLEPCNIEGLYFCKDFLEEEQANSIAHKLLSHEKNWRGVSACPTSRRVLQFGKMYAYAGEAPQFAHPIPFEFQEIADAVSRTLPFEHAAFSQMIVNEYTPGQGITPHIDNVHHFGDTVACITVGGGVDVDFSREGFENHRLYADHRSLYVMTGDARFKWKHGIAMRKTDTREGNTVARELRYSLTFRSVSS